VFRVIISPILRSTRLCYNAPTMLPAGTVTQTPNLRSYFTGSCLVLVYYPEFDRNRSSTLSGKENNEREMKLSGGAGLGGGVSSYSEVA